MSYEVDELYGCWLWLGSTNQNGYATRWDGRRPVTVHREMYTSMVGPIPDGMELDHACRRRACVRPSHMVVVDRRENTRLRSWKYRVRTVKECPRGHEIKRHALRTPEGGFVCRTCNRGEQ